MAEAWSTVVTREPEWDRYTFQQALGLDDYENNLCPGCGLHHSIIDDPEHNVFTFEQKFCGVCAGTAVYARTLAEADDEESQSLGENPPTTTKRAADGRHIMLRRMRPDEVEAKKRRPRRVD